MNRMSRLWDNAWVRLGVGVGVVVILAILPLVLPVLANQTLTRIGVYAVAVLGLNIIMGYSGQVMLGQIFFLGAGAYVTAYGVVNDWNIVVVFVAACIIPGILGLVVALAAARLGGLAIAMVTIALPIIGVPLAKRLSDLTGGSQGTSARFSSAPEWTGLDNDQWQYYVVVFIAVIAFVLAANLVRGRYGRAMAIVRDNEAVARSMGISPYRYKVMAFTIAATFGGVSGFLYMVAVQYTSPETLAFHHSISLLAAMVVGGAASIVGSLLGGAYYVLVPQITNEIDPTITAISQGIILVAVLFLLPGGLVSLPRVVRRLARRRSTTGTAGVGGTTDTAGTGIQTTPPPRDAAPTTEGPETERQGQA